jgi:outer membrane protein OmpA-like peptidoglycan-associated protein
MRHIGFGAVFVVALLALGCRSGRRPAAPASQPALAGEPAVSSSTTLRWADLPASPRATREPAPASLTASDGTGLKLVRLEARAVIEGPIAFTELEFLFHNPSDKRLEGTFALALPPLASVSRFAMRIGGAWQEAEIVEHAKAQQVFETFLHRRVDPALLENRAGNRYTARVFPIAPREDKALILSYSEVLGSAPQYTIGLTGLPLLDELKIRVNVAQTTRDGARRRDIFELAQTAITPDRDFSLPRTAASKLPAVARSGKGFVGRFALDGAGSAAPFAELNVLFDTSASRLPFFEHDVETLSRMIRELAKLGNPRLRVLGFDQEVVEVYRGPASEFHRTGPRTLLARGAAGGTDLDRAVVALRGTPGERVLIVSDGVITLGVSDPDAIVSRMRGERAARVDVVTSGDVRDVPLGGQLARSGARAGSLLSVKESGEQLARAMWNAPARVPDVRVAGADFVYYEQPTSSDELIVYADGVDEREVKLQIDGSVRVIRDWATASAPLVSRSVGRARIEELLQAYRATREPAGQERLKAHIVRLSRQHRVMTPFTSLLVLETEQDYARFGIRRRALTDVVVAGERGVEVTRSPVAPPLPSGSPARRWGLWSAPRPDGDPDRDMIHGSRDRCPDYPETYNGFEDEDGCPDKGRVMLHSGEITILDYVRFAPGTATIDKTSEPLLEHVREALVRHAELTLIGIGGHTDSRENPAVSQRLSQMRARAVRDWLIRAGIAAERLTAHGFGRACPIADNATPDGRARNRRVEFKILATRDDRAVAPFACNKSVGVAVPPPDGSAYWMPQLKSELGRARGEYAQIRQLLARGKRHEALSAAVAFRGSKPDDPLAWLSLGDAQLAAADVTRAARAYGSLVDLNPGQTAVRRATGNLLERAAAAAPALLHGALYDRAIDLYRAAAAERKDHPSSRRLLAYALAARGRFAEAFDVIRAALHAGYDARFGAVDELFRRDLGIIAAVRVHREPAAAEHVREQLERLRVPLPAKPSLTFVVTWETDTSDVALWFTGSRPPRGNVRRIAVDQGYGPEALLVDGALDPAYELAVQLRAAGEQGITLGKLAVVHHDGAGTLALLDKPFALNVEQNAVSLGSIEPRAFRVID